MYNNAYMRTMLDWFEIYGCSTPGVGGCVEWAGSVDTKGYGYFRVGGAKGRTFRAHRAAWFLTKGVWPAGMIRHDCDNRKCVNVKHMRVGTAVQNSGDMVERMRQSRGESRPDAKLTEELVREARSLYPGVSAHELAVRYNVGVTTMWKAVTGRAWRHV